MSTIHIQSDDPEKIPSLLFFPNGANNLPLVFFVHGFCGSKEQHIEVGYQLAKAGLFAVLIDAHLHGERIGPPIDNLDNPDRRYVYPPGTGFDTWQVMFECALHTAADIHRLIEHYAADPRVDASLVGVSGFSMGGFTTYLAAAENPRITAAVPIGAYPSIEQAWRNYALEAAAYDDWADEMNRLENDVERRAAWFRSIDPYLKMKDSYRQPLLMMVGDKDTDAPKVYNLPLFSALRPHYQHNPDWLKLKIYDGTVHTLTAEMIQDAAQWFRRFLVKETG
jgi:uncharacterized protein